MSALSISPVAVAGSSAQAPAQPGAPDDAAANSPFAILLAAITAADPSLQASIPASPAQTAPAADGQNSVVPDPKAATVKAANDDDDADMETGNTAADPGEIAAPKSGGKPDKKAGADKGDQQAAANALVVQSQIPVMPQLFLAPMAQAAAQAQAVAGDDSDGDTSATAAIGASGAGGIAAQVQSGAVSHGKPPAPNPAEKQPASSSPSQSVDAAKDAAAQMIPTLTAANDDSDDDEAAAETAAPPIHTESAGPKFAQLRSPGGEPAAQPQMSAPVEDADIDIEPSATPNPPANAPAQASVQKPQSVLENAASVFTAEPAPQKPAADSTGKSAAGKAAGTVPSQINAAANANAPAPNAMPAPAATQDNDGDSKPARAVADAAPQAQADAPQMPLHVATDAMPQATLAINAAGGTNAPGGPTVSVHIANHASDSQSSSTVTPDTDALAISVAARSLSGSKQFDIRLDPPELGRVEVRLSIDASGKTQAHMTTDQPQTLELLQKDAPNLTRALRDAGLDVSQNGLNFSLKGQSQNQGGQSGNFGNASRSLSLPATVQSIEPAQPAGAISSLLGNARLDIHV